MEVIKDAILSECGRYRYLLTRVWDAEKPKVIFIGVNPSTADAQKDDQTIRKLIWYAKRGGFGGIKMLNLFAFRSVKPKPLVMEEDPIGPLNHFQLMAQIGDMEAGDRLIFMWGKNASKINRKWEEHIKKNYGDIAYCFKINKDGSPAHPLFLAGDIEPIKYR
jgi:hypothetical protein